MFDSFGRNIEYIRVSLTDRCNLKCIYCMPENAQTFTDNSTLNTTSILNILHSCADLGIHKIRFTGGEPLLFDDIVNLIYETSKLKKVDDISITTNGILLYDMASELKNAGLKRVNISLDTLISEKYSKITRGGSLNKVLNAIQRCLSIGLNPVKLNMVVIKGINDSEINDFIHITKDIPVHVRFIELMPIGEGNKYYKNGLITSKEILEKHPDLQFEEMRKGSTSETYRLKNALGVVEFISPISHKFCKTCNKIRLTSSCSIKPCLHSQTELNLRSFLADEELLTEALKNAILSKPYEHKLEVLDKSECNKMMCQIGG